MLFIHLQKMKKRFLFYYFKQYVSWDEYGYCYFSDGNWVCSINSMFKWYFELFCNRFNNSKNLLLSLVPLLFTRFNRQRCYVCSWIDGDKNNNEWICCNDGFKIKSKIFTATYNCSCNYISSFFANFSTVGMIYGTYNSLFGGEKSSIIGKNVWKLLVSGMAVSLLSAMLVGLFVW